MTKPLARTLTLTLSRKREREPEDYASGSLSRLREKAGVRVAPQEQREQTPFSGRGALELNSPQRHREDQLRRLAP